MVDYKLLHALATVVECGGFERAGDVMGLSQSAISQRIKALEIRLGQPVLVRHPARAHACRPAIISSLPAGAALGARFTRCSSLSRKSRAKATHCPECR